MILHNSLTQHFDQPKFRIQVICFSITNLYHEKKLLESLNTPLTPYIIMDAS